MEKRKKEEKLYTNARKVVGTKKLNKDCDV